MGWRVRWLVLIFGVLLVAVVGTSYALPELVRRGAVARIQASTNRPSYICQVSRRHCDRKKLDRIAYQAEVEYKQNLS